MPYSNTAYNLYKDNPLINPMKALYMPYKIMNSPTAFQDLATLNSIPSNLYPMIAMREKVNSLKNNEAFANSFDNSIGARMAATGMGFFPTNIEKDNSQTINNEASQMQNQTPQMQNEAPYQQMNQYYADNLRAARPVEPMRFNMV